MFKKITRLLTLLFSLNGLAFSQNQVIKEEEGLEYLLFEEIPLVIVASAKMETLEQAPANVFVLTGEQLKARGYRSLFDLIQKGLPGVTWENSVGNEKNGATVVRGLLYQKRIKTILDGMVLDDKAGSGYGWAERIPIEGIDRVEFLLGPYASLYGRSSFAGVLNIITKSGQMVSGGEISAMVGEWEQWQAVGVIGQKIGSWDLYLSASKNKSEEGQDWTKDYSKTYARENREGKYSPVTGGTVEFDDSVTGDWYNPWDNSQIYLKIKNEIGLQAQYEWNRAIWPGAGGFLTPLYYDAPKDCTLVDVYHNARLSYEYSNDQISSTFSIHYQTWDQKQRLDYLSGLHRWYQAETEATQIEEKLRINITENHSLYLGFSYEDVELLPMIGSPRTNPAQKPIITSDMYQNFKVYNFSIQDDIKITEQLKTVVGIYYENSDSYKDVYLPRFSLVWDITERTVLKLLYGGGYIIPDAITVNDQNIGQGASVKGTTGLDPETLTSYEINLIQKIASRSKISMSIFLNQVENMIALAPYTDPTGYYGFSYKNFGEQETKGLEVTLDWVLSDVFKIWAHYAYLDGGYDSISENGAISRISRLPLSPSNHVKLGINALLFDEKINFFLYDYYLDEIDTWVNERLDGYNIIDLHLNTTKNFHPNWGISLAVTNLFDKKAFDAPIQDSVVTPNTPIDRRGWTFQLNYKF